MSVPWEEPVPGRRRLDVGSLRPRDIILTVDGVDYELPGRLAVDDMILLYDLGARLQAAGTQDPRELFQTVSDAQALIVTIVKRHHPAFVLAEPWGIGEITAVVAFLAQAPAVPVAAKPAAADPSGVTEALEQPGGSEAGAAGGEDWSEL